MKKNKLSVVVIARNEELMIRDCLKSARGVADEMIVMDRGSTDQTCKYAKEMGARVINIVTKEFDYSRFRNEGLRAVGNDWLFYLDADERITPALQKEILLTLEQAKYAAYEIPRQNYFLGQAVNYGGAGGDYVKRLFNKKSLKQWRKKLHEEPVISGNFGRLNNSLLHYTHRDLSSMLEKTREWSKIEAQLLLESGHPPVTWWRFFRPMVSEFWRRGIVQQGFRDGTVGWIEAIYQTFSRFITYARLWELQQKSCLPAGREKI